MTTILRTICERNSQIISRYLGKAGILSSGQHLCDFMQTNRLSDPGEQVFDVFNRSTRFLAQAGHPFYGEQEISRWHYCFLEEVCNFRIILGSPMLTNAGRREKSVSACSIPPVKLSLMSKQQIAQIVGDYHTRSMGTGFSLDDVSDPAEMVKYLNAIAMSEVQRGQIERSVGNMGVLSIHHPKVIEFIRVKQDNPQIKEWKFNLSVNLTEPFIQAWTDKQLFTLSNGEQIDPTILMAQIAEQAHATGDPGLVFMDRINALNRVPHLGRYETVVPCGEVSLFSGEVCQFAYLNLPKFLVGNKVDWIGLQKSIHTIMVILDNAVEANIKRMPNAQSAQIISTLRRVGIGVCGFAEVLQAQGLSYSTEEARDVAKELMSFINFESKRASVALAKQRSVFPAFEDPRTRFSLFTEPFANYPTSLVSRKDWIQLAKAIKQYGLRNLSTTIIPPTGRSSLMAGVTSSIEPPFRLVPDETLMHHLERHARHHGYEGTMDTPYHVITKTGSVQHTDLPSFVKEIFKTALELTPHDHLRMTAAFQTHTDEGISKTVNLVEGATVQDVQTVFQTALYPLNLKGITIYRNNSRSLQPKSLSNAASMTSHTIVDPIYGPVLVSSKIAKILTSPLMERLKGIHQNGVAHLVDPRQSTSRYEHSVGAMILAKMLGANESEQIAALLHDVSHTPFSHIADLVFSHDNQDYHDHHRSRFLQSSIVQKALKECGITPEELDCAVIPLIKGNNLNVDRLDYFIRDLKAVNRIYHPEYSSILNNLVIEDGVIKCRNLETARLLFNKFLEVNEEVYFDPKIEAASVAMATLLRTMLKEGLLSEQDFELSETELIKKIEHSPYRKAFMAIGPDMQVTYSDIPNEHPPILRKLRYLDPPIVGLPGTLTDHCPIAKKRLETYLNTTPKKLYYNF